MKSTTEPARPLNVVPFYGEGDVAVLDVTPIPMEQFALKWRFIDPRYRALPPVHLEQVKPLSPGLSEPARPRWCGVITALRAAFIPNPWGRFRRRDRTSMALWISPNHNSRFTASVASIPPARSRFRVWWRTLSAGSCRPCRCKACRCRLAVHKFRNWFSLLKSGFLIVPRPRARWRGALPDGSGARCGPGRRPGRTRMA